ncbi:MAG TPA: tetratricopeptide repeat protein [Crinalium sp.]|jgi:serine/threonine-protein kinase
MVNQLLNGRYQFIKVLGSDELEQTYLVGDTKLPGYPKCVIRHLQLPISKTPRTLSFVLTLLKKKAETLKGFSKHHHLPEILDYFEEGNNFYLVEEFVLGQPLSDEIVPNRPLAEEYVVKLLQEILEILVVVHGWGLVHRCIKPSSLIRRKTDGTLVLTGFGIFKAIGAQGMRSQINESETHTNGSSAYVPPDQLQGQLNFNSDLYAVGMICIQALTGLSAEDLLKLAFINPSGIRELSWRDHAHVSSKLMMILDRMVHPDGDQRYQQASEVLDDLGRSPYREPDFKTSASTTTTLPRPESPLWADRVKHFRTPAIAALIGLALIAIAIATRLPQSLLSRYFLHRGSDQEQRNETQEAIASYTQAIQANPDSHAYYQRGLAYSHAHQLQKALDDLTKAIQLNPKLAEAYYQRGNTLFELGDTQRALADYTQSLQINPKQARVYVNRGTARAETGDEQSAIADYTQAIQLDPNLTEAYLNRCLSRSNLEDHQGAIADCTQAINLQPNSVLAYQNRGLARRRVGDLTGAIADFNIAIRLNPQDADPYYNRGLARYDLGDKQGAIADYTAAIQNDPNHVFAYYDRGLVRLEQGDKEGAIADFQQSAKLCLDSGRTGCYQDAQFQLNQLK